jgi:voltage-gated potassium channel
MKQSKYFLKIKQTVEEQTTTAGKVFDWFIMTIIFVSLVSFAIQTLPDLSKSAEHALRISETVIVAIFTVEYLLRLFVADRKLKFVFSFYGIIDLLAILPFYLPGRVDLRFLRILRVLKLFRYSKAFQRYKLAIYSIRHELFLFIMIALFLLFIAAAGIYYFENSAQPEVYRSIFHSLWWAIVTLTTVGYGDVVPITIGGRIFTFVMLLIGLGVFAVPVGLISSALTKTSTKDDKDKKE